MREILFDGVVILVLVAAVLFSVFAKAASAAGKLVKIAIIVLPLVTAIPLAIYEFGEPLAGVLYLVLIRYAATVLLLLTIIALWFAYRRGESRAFVTAAGILAVIAAAAAWLAPLMVMP